MLTKKLYEQATGRSQKSNIIAYQIRQSFRPGEITAEEANRIGYELAFRFLKGKHAFIVATHTDREHIHNHIIYNSTTLDGTRKFRDFFFSGLAVQRLSDLICLEHQLSVIEKKPYRERQKRITYPPKESNRDRLCSVIDEILQQKPTDYEDFLQKLEQQGYEIKRGKYTSVKGARQKRFIRFKTLGAGYSEDEIKAVIAGKAEHRPHQKQPPKEQPFQLLVDIQAKLAEGKGGGYERWAKKYNLKEMSKTLIFLQEQKIGSADDLKERADTALSRYHKLGDSIKVAEKRMAEIAVLRAHIVNYAKTRPVYDAYRKSGYSSKFLEAHREEITLHKAAKAAFNESGLKKLPKVKDLNEGYGPQHIATYLNNSGYRARSGKCWHPSSIRGMVQNLTYTGVLRCGDARSELMPDLQIVPQEQFENAQRIRNERSVRSTAEAENRLPLNIHGKSLLAGNAYCGHCGAKLELTSSRKWRKMADGSLDDTLRIRYTCYGKLRKQTNCTGQTGYTVHILDEIIDKAVRQIFSKMRGIPKEQIVTKRYEKENAERKNHLQDLQTQRNKAEKDLFALKTEVLACIKGESVLPRETLAEMITAQEEKLTELENLCEAASEELEKTAELMDKVSRLYDELISYADLYDSANFEAKKMIVNQLIRRVDVYRGYQINISFNFDLTPYIEGE